MNREELSVSVVIPVFNEELTIGDIVARTRSILGQFRFPSEVLVIDDGSVDRSAEISQESEARVLRGAHKGKGHALRFGFKQAKGDIIVTLDSDGSHNPEEIPLVLRYILENKVDFVIGSRFFDTTATRAKIPKVNRIGNMMFNNLIRLLTGVRVSDSQSGFRAIRSSVIKKMRLNSRGYEVESEMLVKALKMGVRVAEIPVSFEQRTIGKSKLDPLRDGTKILYSIITSYLS
ncbi:MAG: glycosyltransferase family 2 protein [Candidatus Bathyarchaeota archaeon]|nr:MAG: glycosyltransferase family 2 protein [Candidatus Bathyarchaeota archaeon]